MLGNCYYLGKGVEMDAAKAVRLYGQAAEKGLAAARCWLGWSYEHGQGARQDGSAAVEQYRLAVEGGCKFANVSLGLCVKKGRGMPRSDPVEAARLYALAADIGAAFCNEAFNRAMDMLPDQGLARNMQSAAALARTRHAVHQLNLAARFGHVAAVRQLEALAGRRNVLSARCVGCGAVRKLKACSKCCVARFCDMECTTRMWPAHKASCKARERMMNAL
jgi:TPR repeat protein